MRHMNLLALVLVLATGWLGLQGNLRAVDCVWNPPGAGTDFSDANNWVSGTVPGVNDTAVYSASSVVPCVLDINVNVKGFVIQAGYTGTITQAAGVTVTIDGDGFAQADGAFVGGDSAITITGPVAISGGAFTATSGVLTAKSDWTVTNAPTFNANGGTASFAVSYAASQTIAADAFSFNNVEIKGHGQSSVQTISGTLTVMGNLTLGMTAYSGHHLNGGVINLLGDITITSSDFGNSTTGPGTVTIRLVGTGAQTLAGPTTGHFPNIEVAKPAGTVTLSGTPLISGNWTWTSGALDPASSLLIFACTYNSTQTIIGGSVSYGDVAIRGWGGTSVQTIIGTLTVGGDLQLAVTAYAGNKLNGGVISVHGNIEMGSAGFGTLNPGTGSATIQIAGSGAQTLSALADGIFPSVEVAKPAGTLTITDAPRITGSWTHVSGDLAAANSTLVLSCPYNGTQTITPGSAAYGNVTVEGNGQNSVQNVVGSFDVGGNVLLGISNYGGNEINGGPILAHGDVTMGSAAFGGLNPGPGSMLIKFVGAGAQTLAAPAEGYFPNMEIAKPSGLLTISGAPPIVGDYTYTSGDVNFGGSTLVLACPYNGTQTITPGNLTYGNVTIKGNGQNSVQTVVGTFNVAGHLVLDVNTYGGNHLNGGGIHAQGDVSLNSSFGTGSGGAGSTVLTLNGSGEQTFAGNGTGRVSYVVIDKPTGQLNLTGTINVTGDWTQSAGLVVPGSSTVTFLDGTNSNIVGSAVFGNLTINKSIYTLTTTAQDDLTVLGDLTVTARPLNLTTGKTLTVGGNLTVGTTNGAALNVNQAALVFNGVSQQTVDFGNSSVANVSVENSAGAVVFARAFTQLSGGLTTFAPGASVQFPITGTTTLQNIQWSGSPTQAIMIRSTTPGTAASLNVTQANPVTAYLDVQDNNAAAGSTITAFYSTDSGNNTNWSFPVATPLVIAETDGLTAVSEAGNGDSYSVRLGFAPQQDVTVLVAPDGELQTDKSALVFTSGNWNMPQTVTVHAVDDYRVQGSRAAPVLHSAASADVLFDGAQASLSVTINDDDFASIQLVESAGSTDVAEGGATDSYTLVLTAQPEADVTITVVTGTQVTVSPAQVIFTDLDWSVPQTITVTAVDDAVVEGAHNAVLSHTTASADAHFEAIFVPDVIAHITDNDAGGGGDPTAVSLTTGQPLPVPTGTLVMLTAQPVGGSNLEYNFQQVIDGQDVGLTGWTAIDHYLISPAPIQATTFTYKVQCRQVGGNAVDSTPFAVEWQTVPVNSIALVADLTSPQLTGTGLNLTVTPATGGPTAEYQFIEQKATYTVVLRDWSHDAAFDLAPVTQAGQRFFFARARNEGNAVYVESPVINFTWNHGDPIFVDLTPDKASPQLPGTAVTFTAHAVGGGDLHYEFVQLDGSTETVLATNSLLPFFTVATTAHQPEAHQYFVRVKSGTTGTPVASEPPLSYAWHATPLTAVALTTSLESPLTVGTDLVLTAIPTGGENVEYEFVRIVDGVESTIPATDGNLLLNTVTEVAPTSAEDRSYFVRAQYNNATVESAHLAVSWLPANPSQLSVWTTLNAPVAPTEYVTFNASAIGGTNVKYQFSFVEGTTETVKQGFGHPAGAAFEWTEATPTVRTIRVRAHSDGQVKDLVANITFSWGYQQPSSVYLSGDAYTFPLSPNDSLTLTAFANGGSNLQYQFWQYDRHDNEWTEMNPGVWSSDNFVTLTPTAPQYGGFMVRVRTGGTAVAGLASNIVLMDWTPADPTSLSLVALPATAQPLNSPVTFTATAGGDGPFEYRFVQIAGTTETTVRDWNPANTYVAQPATGLAAGFKAYVRAESRALQIASNQVNMNWSADNPAFDDPAMTILGNPALLQVGVTYTVLIHALGGQDVEYRFTSPVSSDWSSSNEIQWTPSAADTYDFNASIRSKGNPTAVSTTVPTQFSVTIATGPLVSVTLASSAGAALAVGNPVTLTATPQGGSSLQYQFFQRGTPDVALTGWTTQNNLTIASPTEATTATYYVRAQDGGAGPEFQSNDAPVYWYGNSAGLVTLTPDLAAPQLPGVAVTLTAASPATTNPWYRFVEVDNGVETLLQDYSATATFPLAVPAAPTVKTYAVYVRAANNPLVNRRSPNLEYNWAFPNPDDVTVTTNPAVSPQLVGTAVTLTAGATDGMNVEYQFYETIGSGAPALIRDWNTDVNLVVPNLPTHTETRSYFVLARSQAQTTAVKSALLEFQWNSAEPAAVVLTATPADNLGYGQNATLTAVATGGFQVEYQFVQDDNGTLTVVQAWSASNTFRITDAPTTDATRIYVAHARNAGATSDVASAPLTITWGSSQPERVILTADQALPTPVQNAVQLTALATGGTGLEFEFVQINPQTFAQTVVQTFSVLGSLTLPAPGTPETQQYLVRARALGQIDFIESDPYTVIWAGSNPPQVVLSTDPAWPASPLTVNTTTKLAATLSVPAGAGDFIEYSFYRYDGEPVLLQNWSPVATFTLTASDVPDAPMSHNYVVQSRAQGRTDFTQSEIFTLTWVPVGPSAVTLTPDQPSPQLVLSQMQLTAAAEFPPNTTSIPALEYQFIRLTTNGFEVERSWSNLANWQVTPVPTAYQVRTYAVQVRVAGEASLLQSDPLNFVWTTPHPSSVQLQFSPLSPQQINTQVILSAAAVGGVNVEYQFFEIVGGVPSLLPGQTGVSTYALPSVPTVPDSRSYMVRANSSGQSLFVESNSDVFSWTPDAAIAVVLTADPVNSQMVSKQVVLTAQSATQDLSYRYEARVNGGAWVQFRNFDSNPIAGYTASLPAQVEFRVTVKDQNDVLGTAVLAYEFTAPESSGGTNPDNYSSPQLVDAAPQAPILPLNEEPVNPGDPTYGPDEYNNETVETGLDITPIDGGPLSVQIDAPATAVAIKLNRFEDLHRRTIVDLANKLPLVAKDKQTIYVPIAPPTAEFVVSGHITGGQSPYTVTLNDYSVTTNGDWTITLTDADLLPGDQTLSVLVKDAVGIAAYKSILLSWPKNDPGSKPRVTIEKPFRRTSGVDTWLTVRGANAKGDSEIVTAADIDVAHDYLPDGQLKPLAGAFKRNMPTRTEFAIQGTLIDEQIGTTTATYKVDSGTAQPLTLLTIADQPYARKFGPLNYITLFGSLSYPYGTHTVTLEFTDGYGNTTVEIFSVNLAYDSYVGSGPIQIRINKNYPTVIFSGAVKLFRDDVPLQSNGLYFLLPSLPKNGEVLHLKAWDIYGNVKTADHTVYYQNNLELNPITTDFIPPEGPAAIEVRKHIAVKSVHIDEQFINEHGNPITYTNTVSAPPNPVEGEENLNEPVPTPTAAEIQQLLAPTIGLQDPNVIITSNILLPTTAETSTLVSVKIQHADPTITLDDLTVEWTLPGAQVIASTNKTAIQVSWSAKGVYVCTVKATAPNGSATTHKFLAVVQPKYTPPQEPASATTYGNPPIGSDIDMWYIEHYSQKTLVDPLTTTFLGTFPATVDGFHASSNLVAGDRGGVLPDPLPAETGNTVDWGVRGVWDEIPQNMPHAYWDDFQPEPYYPPFGAAYTYRFIMEYKNTNMPEWVSAGPVSNSKTWVHHADLTGPVINQGESTDSVRMFRGSTHRYQLTIPRWDGAASESAEITSFTLGLSDNGTAVFDGVNIAGSFVAANYGPGQYPLVTTINFSDPAYTDVLAYTLVPRLFVYEIEGDKAHFLPGEFISTWRLSGPIDLPGVDQRRNKTKIAFYRQDTQAQPAGSEPFVMEVPAVEEAPAYQLSTLYSTNTTGVTGLEIQNLSIPTTATGWYGIQIEYPTATGTETVRIPMAVQVHATVQNGSIGTSAILADLNSNHAFDPASEIRRLGAIIVPVDDDHDEMAGTVEQTDFELPILTIASNIADNVDTATKRSDFRVVYFDVLDGTQSVTLIRSSTDLKLMVPSANDNSHLHEIGFINDSLNSAITFDTGPFGRQFIQTYFGLDSAHPIYLSATKPGAYTLTLNVGGRSYQQKVIAVKDALQGGSGPSSVGIGDGMTSVDLMTGNAYLAMNLMPAASRSAVPFGVNLNYNSTPTLTTTFDSHWNFDFETSVYWVDEAPLLIEPSGAIVQFQKARDNDDDTTTFTADPRKRTFLVMTGYRELAPPLAQKGQSTNYAKFELRTKSNLVYAFSPNQGDLVPVPRWRLASIRDLNDYTVRYEYDRDSNRVALIRDPYDRLYDIQQQVDNPNQSSAAKISDPAGRVCEFTNFTQSVTVAGLTMPSYTFTSDYDGRLAESHIPDHGDDSSQQYALSYDEQNRVISVKRPFSNAQKTPDQIGAQVWVDSYVNLDRADLMRITYDTQFTDVVSTYLERYSHDKPKSGILEYETYEFRLEYLQLSGFTNIEGRQTVYGDFNQDGLAQTVTTNFTSAPEAVSPASKVVEYTYSDGTYDTTDGNFYKGLSMGNLLTVTEVTMPETDANQPEKPEGENTGGADDHFRVTTYEYDKRFNAVTKITDPRNQASQKYTENTYDDRGNLVKSKDPRDAYTIYRYAAVQYDLKQKKLIEIPLAEYPAAPPVLDASKGKILEAARLFLVKNPNADGAAAGACSSYYYDTATGLVKGTVAGEKEDKTHDVPSADSIYHFSYFNLVGNTTAQSDNRGSLWMTRLDERDRAVMSLGPVRLADNGTDTDYQPNNAIDADVFLRAWSKAGAKAPWTMTVYDNRDLPIKTQNELFSGSLYTYDSLDRTILEESYSDSGDEVGDQRSWMVAYDGRGMAYMRTDTNTGFYTLTNSDKVGFTVAVRTSQAEIKETLYARDARYNQVSTTYANPAYDPDAPAPEPPAQAEAPTVTVKQHVDLYGRTLWSENAFGKRSYFLYNTSNDLIASAVPQANTANAGSPAYNTVASTYNEVGQRVHTEFTAGLNPTPSTSTRSSDAVYDKKYDLIESSTSYGAQSKVVTDNFGRTQSAQVLMAAQGGSLALQTTQTVLNRNNAGMVTEMLGSRGFKSTAAYNFRNQSVAQESPSHPSIVYALGGNLPGESDITVTPLHYQNVNRAGQVLKSVSPNGRFWRNEFDSVGRRIHNLSPNGEAALDTTQRFDSATGMNTQSVGHYGLQSSPEFFNNNPYMAKRSQQTPTSAGQASALGAQTLSSAIELPQNGSGMPLVSIENPVALATADLPRPGANLKWATSYTRDGLVKTTKSPDDNNPNLVNETKYTYDDYSRRLLETRVKAVYNPQPLLTQDLVTTYEYDGFGRVAILKQTGKFGQLLTTTYRYEDIEGQGLRTYVTDSAGQTTMTESDPNGRVILTSDVLHRETRYEYDTAGNLIAMIDPKGLATRYEYDSHNRLIRIKRPTEFLGDDTFAYDDEGRLNRKVDARGTTTKFIYETAGGELGLLKEKYILPGSGTEQILRLRYDRDFFNRTFTTHVDRLTPSGWQEQLDEIMVRKIDGYQRTISETHGRHNTILYTYDHTADARGYLTGMSGGSGENIAPRTFEYNANGSLRKLAHRSRGILFAYNKSGSLAARSYQLNNVEYLRRDFTYDGYERLRSEITAAPDNQTGGTRELSHLTHSYNIQHRRISTLSEFEQPQPGQPRQVTLDEYAYDAAGQLLSENFRDLTGDVNNAGLLTSTQQTYAYDRAGNRLRSTSAELTRTYADDFTPGNDRPAGTVVGDDWTAPANEPPLPPTAVSAWTLDNLTAPSGGQLDPANLTVTPGIVTHLTDVPALRLQSESHIPPAANSANTVTFQTRVEVTPGDDNDLLAAADPASLVRGQFIAAALRYEDTTTTANGSAVLAGVYLQQKYVPAVPEVPANGNTPAVPAQPARVDYYAAPVIARQTPGAPGSLPILQLLAPALSEPDLDYRRVQKGAILTLSVLTQSNDLRVSVYTADHVQIGQTVATDIAGYGDITAGRTGLISGPVLGADFDNIDPNASTQPSLIWQDLSAEPVPATVTASFDNYAFYTLTPKMNLTYEYNLVHELTSVTPDAATPGPSESFFYDRAGALTAHSIGNLSARGGAYLGLPDEDQRYTRDMLGRVISGDRTAIDPLTGTTTVGNLAQFSYYGDSYKVRKRSTRQVATLNGVDAPYETSLPFYAGDNVIADMHDIDPLNPMTPPTLQTEYLTAGPVGMDEILAQYTPADIGPGGFAKTASHPVQDVNRRVFMTVKSTVGQPTQMAERALYSAFGERTILEKQTQTGMYENRWLPQGFRDPSNPAVPASNAPNAFSEPLSAVGQSMGFQGRRHEDLPGVMNFRNRLYDARLGRFLERDPMIDAIGDSNIGGFTGSNRPRILTPQSLYFSDYGVFAGHKRKKSISSTINYQFIGRNPFPYVPFSNNPIDRLDPLGLDDIRTFNATGPGSLSATEIEPDGSNAQVGDTIYYVDEGFMGWDGQWYEVGKTVVEYGYTIDSRKNTGAKGKGGKYIQLFDQRERGGTGANGEKGTIVTFGELTLKGGNYVKGNLNPTGSSEVFRNLMAANYVSRDTDAYRLAIAGDLAALLSAGRDQLEFDIYVMGATSIAAALSDAGGSAARLKNFKVISGAPPKTAVGLSKGVEAGKGGLEIRGSSLAKELAFAQELSEKGHSVVVLGTKQKGIDFLINGIGYQYKQLNSASYNAVFQNLEKGFSGSSRVIIDGRKAGLDAKTAMRGLAQIRLQGTLKSADEAWIYLKDGGRIVWKKP